MHIVNYAKCDNKCMILSKIKKYCFHKNIVLFSVYIFASVFIVSEVNIAVVSLNIIIVNQVFISCLNFLTKTLANILYIPRRVFQKYSCMNLEVHAP